MNLLRSGFATNRGKKLCRLPPPPPPPPPRAAQDYRSTSTRGQPRLHQATNRLTALNLEPKPRCVILVHRRATKTEVNKEQAANQLQIVGFLNCKHIASDKNFTSSSLLTSFSLFASRCRTFTSSVCETPASVMNTRHLMS